MSLSEPSIKPAHKLDEFCEFSAPNLVPGFDAQVSLLTLVLILAAFPHKLGFELF